MLRRFRDGVRLRWRRFCRWRTPSPVGRAQFRRGEFPRECEAPRVILEQLQRVDPTADLLYLGWGKWLLVSWRPNRRLLQQAYRALENSRRLLVVWERDPKFRANPGAFRRLYQRYLYWLAASLGARPICDYPAAFVRKHGLEAVVVDFRRMDWMYRTVTDNQLFDANDPQGIEFAKEQLRREADADLRSEYRALDGWMYLKGLSHLVTRADDPMKPRHRSGFTTVATIGADGQRTRTA